MNKQEALKQIEEQRDMILELHGWGVFGYIKGIINQLDEPQKIEIPKVEFKKSQKVKVPQFVADWITHSKNIGRSLFGAMSIFEENFEIKKWMQWAENQETFARAWLDGYEVEEEKKYKITLLNRNDGDLYLVNQNANLADKYGHFSPVVLLFTKGTNFSEKCYKLTKKEVVLYGFGWVFDCPGVQIEEVE